MEPETEFRPGRLLLAGLLACIGPLAWIMLLPVVDEDEVPQDAPMTLVLRLRERGRSDAHRQDGRRGGAPEQIRQLYTKHSISMG